MTERIDHAAEVVNFLGAVTVDTYGDDESWNLCTEGCPDDCMADHKGEQ